MANRTQTMIVRVKELSPLRLIVFPRTSCHAWVSLVYYVAFVCYWRVASVFRPVLAVGITDGRRA